jgi:hypothetical protein
MEEILIENGKWFAFENTEELNKAIDRYNSGEELTGWFASGEMSSDMSKNAKAWFELKV